MARKKKKAAHKAPPAADPAADWTVGTSMHWTKIRVSKTWYKNGQKKLRRAIGFWEA